MPWISKAELKRLEYAGKTYSGDSYIEIMAHADKIIWDLMQVSPDVRKMISRTGSIGYSGNRWDRTNLDLVLAYKKRKQDDRRAREILKAIDGE